MPRPAIPLLALVAAMTSLPTAAAAPDFAADWKRWHDQRVDRLKGPRSWLALVGIHWLAEGENRLDGLPGTFTLAKGTVTLAASAQDGYRLGTAAITQRALESDAGGKGDLVTLGEHRALTVIARGPKRAVRVWDADNPARKSFPGIEAFPPDPRWRVEARWEAYAAPKRVETPTVIGIPAEESAPGRAHFSFGGQDFTLEPTAEDDGLFFVFKDATSKKETYGAGRFLDAEGPKDGKVVLDFNRAVNPPCAYTAYATCPLPRPENVLPVRVEAGEKRPAGH